MQKPSSFAEYVDGSGKTPEQIAQDFAVDRATIYRWKKGDPPIPLKRLAEAERITGLSKTQLRPDIFEGVS